jgi:hypothetical protein
VIEKMSKKEKKEEKRWGDKPLPSLAKKKRKQLLDKWDARFEIAKERRKPLP